MKKLNLGCGEFKKAGYINLDSNPSLKPDIVHNLDIIPYPFADFEFDHIEADHVLEHLDDPFAVMGETYRILKSGGSLVIRVPHFSRGLTHPDHKRGFDVTFPYYFSPSFKGGYAGVPFELAYVRLRWFAQPYLKISVLPKVVYYPAAAIGKIIDFFANVSPMVCSRVWCFWVGGFEEIEFHFFKK